MEFELKKCSVLEMKRGKKVRVKGITLLDGRIMGEIGEEGYKYLGIIEAGAIKEKEMKEKCNRVKEKAETNVEINIECKE